jgi:hypothetical protein
VTIWHNSLRLDSWPPYGYSEAADWSCQKAPIASCDYRHQRAFKRRLSCAEADWPANTRREWNNGRWCNQKTDSGRRTDRRVVAPTFACVPLSLTARLASSPRQATLSSRLLSAALESSCQAEHTNRSQVFLFVTEPFHALRGKSLPFGAVTIGFLVHADSCRPRRNSVTHLRHAESPQNLHISLTHSTNGQSSQPAVVQIFRCQVRRRQDVSHLVPARRSHPQPNSLPSGAALGLTAEATAGSLHLLEPATPPLAMGGGGGRRPLIPRPDHGHRISEFSTKKVLRRVFLVANLRTRARLSLRAFGPPPQRWCRPFYRFYLGFAPTIVRIARLSGQS